MAEDPYQLAHRAGEELRARTGVSSFDVAVVMGSGWVRAADILGEPSVGLPWTVLPGFTPPSVEGHVGSVRAVELGGRQLLVFLGRTHLYEGRGPLSVVHGVRTALAAGVRTVILTNAAGGLRPAWQRIGDPVIIRDHINLTGHNPILGTGFVDMTEAYSRRLRLLVAQLDPYLQEGVYAGLGGPSYETPAEIRMLQTIGADLAGMSTVLETIAAREGGAEVLGISLVTNIGAGLTTKLLDHTEVLAAGAAAAERMGELLAKVVNAL